jgi:ferric-dicitrate binding protein FerR (iron transport regulator)
MMHTVADLIRVAGPANERVHGRAGASARAKADLTPQAAQLQPRPVARRRGARRAFAIGLAGASVAALLYLMFFAAARVVQTDPAPTHAVIPPDLSGLFGSR